MSNSYILAQWRDRWSQNLVRFLRSRVRASVDVDDLAQETYLRLLRAPDLRTVRNPEAYLIRVASHIVAEWRQKNALTATLDPANHDQLQLSDHCTPELETAALMSRRCLSEALAQLPPLTRAVLLMRLRDGEAYKDIARVIGITARQVKRHLARGYDCLRKALEL
jgi:RNA polymerase sigma factor (sigma-70 family)